MADITLKTWRKKEEIVPVEVTLKNYTGREQKRYTLIIGNIGFHLYFLEKNPYMCYDKAYKIYPLSLEDRFILPIGIACETYREYEGQEAVWDKPEEDIYKEMREDFQNQNPQALIISDNLEKKDMGSYFLLSYRSVCLEKAGEIAQPEE